MNLYFHIKGLFGKTASNFSTTNYVVSYAAFTVSKNDIFIVKNACENMENWKYENRNNCERTNIMKSKIKESSISYSGEILGQLEANLVSKSIRIDIYLKLWQKQENRLQKHYFYNNSVNIHF
eukprot:168519_1